MQGPLWATRYFPATVESLVSRVKVQMKIKRGWQLFAAVIEVAIMAAVALFGAVMIAVPVPILLHFLSKYGVTGTPATMICRLAGVLLLIAGLWATRYCWRLLTASFRG
jgi:protein-S-isoprenylcysteine O-methyltransferase Ste14